MYETGNMNYFRSFSGPASTSRGEPPFGVWDTLVLSVERGLSLYPGSITDQIHGEVWSMETFL